MSKRLIAFLIGVAIAIVAASAADYQAYGFTQDGTRNIDGIDYLVLTDEGGGELLFSALVEPSADRLSALKSIVAVFRSWDGLAIASLRATNDASQLRVTAIPSSLQSGGKELKAAIPGGLVFYYDKAVEYDFRVLSGAYAIRMNGLYTTTKNLVGSLDLAFSDPVKWLLRTDPEYAIRQITALSARVEALDSELGMDVNGLTSANGKLASVKDQLSASVAKQDAMQVELDALKADFANLDSAKNQSDKASAATIARLETSLMTALNVGFFSGPKPIPQETVDWVVAKKTAEPGLDKAALAKLATAEKVKASEKEIGIVLQVKFGER